MEYVTNTKEAAEEEFTADARAVVTRDQDAFFNGVPRFDNMIGPSEVREHSWEPSIATSPLPFPVSLPRRSASVPIRGRRVSVAANMDVGVIDGTNDANGGAAKTVGRSRTRSRRRRRAVPSARGGRAKSTANRAKSTAKTVAESDNTDGNAVKETEKKTPKEKKKALDKKQQEKADPTAPSRRLLPRRVVRDKSAPATSTCCCCSSPRAAKGVRVPEDAKRERIVVEEHRIYKKQVQLRIRWNDGTRSWVPTKDIEKNLLKDDLPIVLKYMADRLLEHQDDPRREHGE